MFPKKRDLEDSNAKTALKLINIKGAVFKI